MQKQTKDRLRRSLGYAAFSLAASLLFSYWTFPWDAARQRLEGVLQTALQPTDGTTVQVAIGELGSSWFTGVVAKRLLISRQDPSHPDAPPQSLVVPSLTVRLELLPLFRARPTVAFHTSLAGGTIAGQLGFGRKDDDLRLEIAHLDLAKAHDLLSLAGGLSGADLGLELAGSLSSKASFSFSPKDPTTLKGSLSIGTDQGILKGGKFGEYDLPQVALGKLDIQARAAGGKLDFSRFTLHSDDVDLASDGFALVLNRNLGYSMPHGKLRVHFGPGLLKRVPYLGLGLSALHPPDREGYYSLPLGGTLKSPKLM